MLTGFAQASPVSPSVSASPNPGASASPSPSASAGASRTAGKAPAAGKPGGTCTVTGTGHLADCQKPVAKAALPAGARNTGTLDRPVTDLASLVDTRTWTTGGGNTFPGAEVPYGMVQWSPDTLPDRNAGGGYSYTDTSLTGYSLDHVSGPGCGAAGDVPILPVTSALPSGSDPNSVTTAFSHTGETAQAGYYSAQSNGSDHPVTSEFTAAEHSSMGRFTFPKGSDAGFDIKLQDSQTTVTADTAQVVGNDEVTGSVTTGDFCGESENDGQSQLYTVYFDIKFDQPFASSQVITASGKTSPSAVYVGFDITSNPVVQAKVGISYVSAANARLNWQTDNAGWNFATVEAAARRTWNGLLGRIKVSGDTYAKTQQFYSMLYKDFIDPNVTSDVNGQFMGSDDKVHSLAAGQKNQYGMYSGWDIYHTTAQLQAMLDPSAASDQAQSQVNYYAEDSLFQQWGYLQDNNYVMVGDPEDAILSDYYAFGAHGFDTKQALADMVKEATTVNDARPGEALEQKYGYLPEDGSYGCCNAHGVIATQLEDDIADFALSDFAKSLGDNSDAAMLKARANNWENTFDPNNGLLNARYANGQFEPGITETTQQDNEPDYVEGDAYEYLWEVPNDYPTLFNLLGGPSKVVPALEKYLSQPNASGVYAEIANEFDLGEQYAPYYAGDPAAAQTAIHTIETTVYQPGPSGLANNDDLGAMSATDIWQQLGLYPENPGSDTLLLSTPGFAHEQVSLPNGRTITINAPGANTEYYAKSLRINGVPDQKLATSYTKLSKGANLDWTLSAKPTSWGTSRHDAPPSDTAGTTATVGYLTDQTAMVAPGKSGTITVGADNATDKPQKVAMSIAAPAGVTITPGSATIEVPPHATATTKLTVSAGADTTQNFYSAPVTLTTKSTGATQKLNQTVLVAAPGSLLSTFDSVGISDSSDEAAADIDGDGDSYSAAALAADGFTAGKDVTVDGVTFTWPLPAGGLPDNTVPDGQTLTLNAPAGTQRLAFLGSATGGPVSGPATLHYSDGSTATYYLGLSDWTLNAGSSKPSYGNKVAATTTYRNCPSCTGGQQSVATDIFYTALPVDSAKTLTGVTLPSGTGGGQEHIFSVGTSTTAATGPVATSLSTGSAKAGEQVTIHGSGFGSSQGNGYVAFSDNGTSWGSPGNTATFTVDSWSDTAVTFTVPTPSGTDNKFQVWAGTPASVGVVDNSGDVSDSPELQITPTADPADYYDNVGITDDSDTSCADFDGLGYSYSAQALSAAGLTPGGTVTSDGLTYTWPKAASCKNDDILAAGQTILVNGTAGASKLGLLESSSNGSTSGPVTVTYTDGTSTTRTVSSSDWAGSAGPDETAVATMSYRNASGAGSQAITMYVYATTVPIDPTRTVASVTFPDVSATVANSAMHVFALTTG
ncbi:GH92 family glycosyl hydrolase [Streptantibioticus silvisoli]|uniref:GH92 family glycosyl hydrolase n=1 Tax=Streptantibioticus silvisoli TaxID=2705255 RepID=A0ABT6VY85_9ACTN|nr:GH92 family glycosyl hydrolase [Streptantibioticus silvisoli]MDI5963450.1 GH92 family glycosyl hydrolase [Streptantibioticus silvisoli]